MEIEFDEAILDSIRTLTIVTRFSVFFPRPEDSIDSIRTQIIFHTNELIYRITKSWTSVPIGQAVETWRNEILKLSERLPPYEKEQLGCSVDLAIKSLSMLSKTQRTRLKNTSKQKIIFYED